MTIRLNAGSLLFSALAMLGFLSAAAPAPAQDVKKYAHEFYHDFRGKPLPQEFQIVGKAPEEFIKEEPLGFRVTLPNTWRHEFGGVGCRTLFTVKGDFEVTGAFEILQAEVPAKGFGVGASLRVQQAEPDPQGATFARVVRAGGNQMLFWDRGPDKNGKFVGAPNPCDAKILRLRFVRTGPALHYLWAPGLQGDEFQEIRVEDRFGANDLSAVRMSVITGRELCNVDVRFIDLRIRSNADNDAAVPNVVAAGAPPKAVNAGWLSALAIIGGAVVMVLFFAVAAVILIVRRRSAEPPAAEDFVTFLCPACGKNLKAKSTSAGKNVKCAKCGNVTVVPGAEVKHA